MSTSPSVPERPSTKWRSTGVAAHFNLGNRGRGRSRRSARWYGSPATSSVRLIDSGGGLIVRRRSAAPRSSFPILTVVDEMGSLRGQFGNKSKSGSARRTTSRRTQACGTPSKRPRNSQASQSASMSTPTRATPRHGLPISPVTRRLCGSKPHQVHCCRPRTRASNERELLLQRREPQHRIRAPHPRQRACRVDRIDDGQQARNLVRACMSKER